MTSKKKISQMLTNNIINNYDGYITDNDDYITDNNDNNDNYNGNNLLTSNNNVLEVKKKKPIPKLYRKRTPKRNYKSKILSSAKQMRNIIKKQSISNVETNNLQNIKNILQSRKFKKPRKSRKPRKLQITQTNFKTKKNGNKSLKDIIINSIINPSKNKKHLSLTNPNVSLTNPNVSSLTNPNVSLTNPNVSLTNPNVSLTNPNVSLTNPNVSVYKSILEETKKPVLKKYKLGKCPKCNKIHIIQSNNSNEETGYNSDNEYDETNETNILNNQKPKKHKFRKSSVNYSSLTVNGKTNEIGKYEINNSDNPYVIKGLILNGKKLVGKSLRV